jgi:hypothetical protein
MIYWLMGCMEWGQVPIFECAVSQSLKEGMQHISGNPREHCDQFLEPFEVEICLPERNGDQREEKRRSDCKKGERNKDHHVCLN